MPTAKSEFPDLFPCDFYTPAELLDPGQMYTVYEIARMLQGLDPDAEVDTGTEEILLDWAIPWVMVNSEDLVVAEPRVEDEPGYYGLKRPEDAERSAGDGATDSGSADDVSEDEAPADETAADDGPTDDGPADER